MIFKVQISIQTTEAKRQILIYNRDKNIIHQMDTNGRLESILGEELKIYMHGYVRNGIIHLVKRVRDRNW